MVAGETVPRRAGRVRAGAAAWLVAALAVGYLATARMGHDGVAHVPGAAVTAAPRITRYRVVEAAGLNARFRRAVGSAPSHTWSRPSEPQRVVGQFVRRREHGRAAMWWTVTDRGLLVHAVAPDGDPSSVFAWWLSHPEP